MTERKKTAKELRAEKHALREKLKFDKRRDAEKKYKRSIIRNFLLQNVAFAIGVPLLWWLIFIHYPLTTMVDVSGTVVESNHHYSKGRHTSSLTYTIRLDEYKMPVRHSDDSGFILFLKPKLFRPKYKERRGHIDATLPYGTKVTVQIQAKDLDKLNNIAPDKALSQYTVWERDKLPRIYGIQTEKNVILDPTQVVWNKTPLWIGEILRFILFFAEAWVLIRLYYFCKDRDEMLGF